MNIVFVSNYLSPHQLPFCLAMGEIKDVNFTFVATLPIREDRKKLGYEDLDKKYPFVVCAYDGEELKNQAQNLIDQADIVIVGTAPQDMIKQRIKCGKVTFKVSERQLKRGLQPLKYPYRYIKWHKELWGKKNCYLLCASAYTAYDFSLFGLFRNRAYKWGYFPQTVTYPDIDKVIKEKQPRTILWVGRLLDWKRPEYMLRLAIALKNKGIDFNINILGTGPMEEQLKSAIAEQGLNDKITMLGSKKVAEVRRYMEQSQIFITTSNRVEGWGAVVNEAMNSGCAVVAGSIVGCAPYLIKNNQNGIIYKHDDFETGIAAVEKLLGDTALCQNLGKRAYKTIVNEWNADLAADRLVKLCKALIKDPKGGKLFADGVCSPAPIIKDGYLPKGEKQ